MNKKLVREVRQVIVMVVSQINLMLSSINDMFDLSLIERGRFYPKINTFAPNDTFKFITSMFAA